MSKKANPTLVGAFVLAALVLTLAAIVILGKFKFRDDRFRCVAFFTGSLWGLDIGAPVTFRGVNIGRVSAIRIDFDTNNGNHIIPVYLDIEQRPDVHLSQTESLKPYEVQALLSQLINQGLRAQLKITSLLTGKLYIDLAFYPGAEARLHNLDPSVFEIPSQASGLEQITRKLESLPLDEILNKVASALDGINSIINSSSTRNALEALETTVDRFNGLLARADAEFPALAAELRKGLGNFAALSATANTLLQNAGKDAPGLSAELKQLMQGLTATTAALTKTLNNLEQLTAKDSLLAYQVAASLREIEQAAASIRHLTDYLQHTPNALLFGQGKESP